MSSLSPILDVVIGLVGVYIAFSLLASWLQERVAAFFNLRSKGLISGIYQLFNGNTTVFSKFMQDPMFNALRHAAENSLPPPITAAAANAAAQAEAVKAKAQADLDLANKVAENPAAYVKEIAAKAPSYLSKEQFGAIFMNLVAQHSDSDTLTTTAAVQNAAAAAPPAQNADGSQAAAGASPAQVAKQFADDMQKAAAALGMESQVSAILAKAGGDYDKFQAGIETWYDDHMDRVSGWYKRKSHAILVVIGLLLAIFFNIDSIRLYSALSCSSALRGAAAIAAAKASAPSTATPTADATFVGEMLNAIPLGWQWPYDDAAKQFRAIEGPLTCDKAPVSSPAFSLPYVLTKLLGFVVTMFALSLGAPFWFDALSCLTNVRSAGKKPDADGKTTTTTTTTA